MRLLILTFIGGALIAAPTIRDIAPHGAQRGKSVQVVLKGADLKPGSKIQTTLPGTVSRLNSTKDTEFPFLVELHKDAPVGVYPVRLLTSEGLTNVVLFSVGDLPEVEEKTDEKKSPQAVAAPVTINGTLAEGDVDTYVFDAKAGQKLVFEVEANVLASAIDPAIELLDAAGKSIAKNDDAEGSGIDSRLEHAFKAAGRYQIRIHDSKYSDQSANFYRLKIGSYPYAEALFPLGGRRGEPVAVQAIGGNLALPVSVKVDTTAKSRFVPVRIPGSASLPFLFELGDKPEVLEGASPMLEPDTVINGRVYRKGEVDKYRLAVKPGEHWMFEVRASSLGTSRLDALVTVYDSKGKKLTSRDDLAGADPVAPFEVPADVDEVTVAVEDLLGRGGPAYGYRLLARREQADFIVRLNTPFVNVPIDGTAIVLATIQRRGYDGAIRLRFANLPKGFHQAGGHVAPSYAQQRFDDPNPLFNSVQSTLTITADPDVAPQNVELRLVAVAETPKGRIERAAEGPGLVTTVKGLRQKPITAAWLEMQLPMAIAPRLAAKLSTPVPLVRISQGTEYPLAFKAERGSVRLQGRLRDALATQVGNLRILQGGAAKDPKIGTLLVNTNFATPTETFDMLTSATADIDGKQVDIFAPIVTFDVAPGYRVWPASDNWRTAPGKAFDIAGTIYREPTFEGGLVKLEMQELPEGVSCAPVEIAAGVREFKLSCQAAASVAKGSHEVQISSQAPDTGRKAKDTYKIPPVAGKLVIQ